MKVIIAASEAVPFAKSGGLADVVGSLSPVLKNKGVDISVIIPQYKSIPKHLKDEIRHIKYIYIDVGWRHQYCGINTMQYKGVNFYFIDNEYYFGRDNFYGYYDDGERFAFFSRAILEVLPHIGVPDILHLNDWQTGMVSSLLEIQYRWRQEFKNIKTLFTIHNLKYQGIFSKDVYNELFGIGDEYFTPDKLEFYGDANYMKGGLVYSNLISTVSYTYAKEIQYPFFGEKLEGLLKARDWQLYGILNGIDYDEYNPMKDKLIFKNYDVNSIKDKKVNKVELQRQLNLPQRDVPIIGIISRLVPQKGFDLIECVLNEILNMDLQLIVLGTGDYKYEDMFKRAQQNYTEKVSANIKFDDTLAHRIYAGSDMFLMPSLFEPCGLSQMIALRYGTIPIVRETGGLSDTVTSYNEFDGSGNGFSFKNYNAHDMLYTIKRAVDFYYNRGVWERLVKRGMETDLSWSSSADKYIELYNKLL
ncbi:glycogen synthase GlgA [Caloramator sp. E03]|uniref:glycogen synthase GlgA n=1 Tax=Caloramator sp. E03 TaxID=2576307 RepID=UPI00111051E3|nr:glycogen synthase GlgA [Caloramator sp. E03]QCX33357.1 glycogen synthase GlgA [Caloramator sp. E03]